MGPEIISLIVLFAMFVVASVKPVNLGLMGFVAAFIVGGVLGDLSAEQIFGVFPGDLFVLLAGITLLFAIAQNNGSVDLLMGWRLRLVGGNVGFVPWIMFGLALLLTSVGALSSAGVAIVAPIALSFAARFQISPLMMGVLVIQGATAGSYSPISPFGAITNGVLQSSSLPAAPGLLFLNSLVFNLVVAAAVFTAFGGLRLLRTRAELEEQRSQVSTEGEFASGMAGFGRTMSLFRRDGSGPSFYQWATIVGLAALVMLALGFGVDVGYAALTIALALVLIKPSEQANAISRMPWSVVLLICGILTYVGVLEEIGTISYMQDLIAGVGSPLVAALAASYVGGVISALASTAAILGAAIPLAAPIIEQSGLSATGVVTAIAVSSAIVDISPLSTNGALLLANVQGVKERIFFKQLLVWAVGVTLLAPLVLWLVFVVIPVI